MFLLKQFLFLVCVSSSETNVLQEILSIHPNTNSSSEQIFETNSSLFETSLDNEPEVVFNNNYSAQIPNEADNNTEEFHSGPNYEANWTFIDKEIVRASFFLYSLSKLSIERKSFDRTNHEKKLYSTMVSIPSSSLHLISALKYSLFTIRQYKTDTEKVLKMEQLVLKTTPTRKDEYFSNSLLLIRLNPKEKYSVCIYYYQMNDSSRMADLFLCQDIMHDHSKHSVHGLLFVLTQYSIILGILIVLQGLFSMRKRRVTHILHQHLMNKTQRLRSTLSSVSLVRQSFSSIEHEHNPNNNHFNSEEKKLKKRIISSPAIVLSKPVVAEPFLKLKTDKNHVHFFFGLDEGSEDNESTDCQSNTTFNSPLPPEPYSDQNDALSSIAHILDTNKPWSKHTIPI